jgi:hypothetical protein
MDAEEQHEAEDHQQQSHHALHSGVGVWLASRITFGAWAAMRENVRKPLNLGGSAHSAVIRGLDPRIHRPRWRTISSNSLFEEGWIAGSSPAMTNTIEVRNI